MSHTNTIGDAPTNNPWRDGLGRTSIRASQILLVITLVSLSIFVLTKVTLVVIPFLLALILAAAIAPVVKWLIKKGMPALWATMLSFVVLLGIFGGVLTGIVFAVKSEWSDLVTHATEGLDKLYAYAQEGPIPLDDGLIADAKNTAVDFFTSSSFGNGALSGISAATSFFAGLVLMVVILFFFLKDGSQIWQFFLNFLSGRRKEKTALAGAKTMEILGGYVRGTATVAAVDAIVIGIALFILEVPLALPLSVLIFIGGFIPLVGATAAGGFAVLIALVSNDPLTALIVLIVVIVVNQLEGNFLQPVVMGNVLSVHGLVILLALTVGTVLAGIIGAILSVPIAAVLWGVIKVWRGEGDADAHSDELEPFSPDATDDEKVTHEVDVSNDDTVLNIVALPSDSNVDVANNALVGEDLVVPIVVATSNAEIGVVVKVSNGNNVVNADEVVTVVPVAPVVDASDTIASTESNVAKIKNDEAESVQVQPIVPKDGKPTINPNDETGLDASNKK